MNIYGQVGPQVQSDGSNAVIRQGKAGEVVVQELHGRFYEQCYRGNLFSSGVSITALSANSITLTATTTPVIGVWNPSTSNVNLVILQATAAFYANAATHTGGGGCVWALQTGQASLTGSVVTPWNRKTLTQSGGQGRGLAAVALTGLTPNLVILGGSALAAGWVAASQANTATGTGIAPQVENIDGSIIVPPGGVLVLLNTVSTTSISYTGNLIWEEVAV